ncbi:MAG: NAD(+) synthase [Clostridiales bacterium]|nr:NAD(+) synthase [Clostridiales bacterium]
MRKYDDEIKSRVQFIQNILEKAGADGIVYGNSGGKDSTLVGILCKIACKNTIGLVMPCGSKQNYGTDKIHAEAVGEQYDINVRVIDLLSVKTEILRLLGENIQLTDNATANIAPRLRMTVLYSVAASENRLVAGTGNRSEEYVGYFTKWGDGAFDFNPIADLTVTEVYEFLRYLGVKDFILDKAPSAGLFDNQTDEKEMGITYRSIDDFLLNGTVNHKDEAIIEKLHKSSEHKRKFPIKFRGWNL